MTKKVSPAQLDREIAETVGPSGGTWKKSDQPYMSEHLDVGHASARVKPMSTYSGADYEWTIWIGPPGRRVLHQSGETRTKAAAKRAAERKLETLRGRGSHHARMAPAARAAMEATAGFSVHTDHEDVIKDNARERFGPDYGDAAERAKRMKAGLVDAQGKITDRGWKQLNKDIATLERNALAWLRKVFGRASDQGHDSYGDLIGGLSFDPKVPTQARNIVVGKDERIDFSDASYGDFARSGAWKGVSPFGQDVLGGHITFFDIQPPEAFELAEETADRRTRR